VTGAGPRGGSSKAGRTTDGGRCAKGGKNWKERSAKLKRCSAQRRASGSVEEEAQEMGEEGGSFWEKRGKERDFETRSEGELLR